MMGSSALVKRRTIWIASLVLSCVAIGTITNTGSATDSGGHGSSAWRPWWRFPVIHTGQESFFLSRFPVIHTTQELIFLRWMDHRHGAGWLHHMTDDEIMREWRWFLVFGPRF